MSLWYTINFGDAMLAGQQLDAIRERFDAVFIQANRPKEMALFFRHESEGRLHCEVNVYISPAAMAVATAVGATPCPRPAPVGLDLLAGSDHAWNALFPERGRAEAAAGKP